MILSNYTTDWILNNIIDFLNLFYNKTFTHWKTSVESNYFCRL